MATPTPYDTDVLEFLPDVTYILHLVSFWVCSDLQNCDQKCGIKIIILTDSIGPRTGECSGPNYHKLQVQAVMHPYESWSMWQLRHSSRTWQFDMPLKFNVWKMRLCPLCGAREHSSPSNYHNVQVYQEKMAPWNCQVDETINNITTFVTTSSCFMATNALPQQQHPIKRQHVHHTQGRCTRGRVQHPHLSAVFPQFCTKASPQSLSFPGCSVSALAAAASSPPPSPVVASNMTLALGQTGWWLAVLP